MVWLLLLQSTSISTAGPIPEPAVLVVHGNYLLLRHLVPPKSLPAEASGDLRLLRVPDGKRSVLLTEGDQREILRRRLPHVKIGLQNMRPLRIEFEADKNSAVTRPCFELNQPIGAGNAIDGGRATVVSCDAGRARVRLYYDQLARAPKAPVALATGSYLGPIVLPKSLPTPAGQMMTFRTQVGPVTVDRSAVLMQPGRPGRSAFVRLSDGNIISATLADDGGNHDAN